MHHQHQRRNHRLRDWRKIIDGVVVDLVERRIGYVVAGGHQQCMTIGGCARRQFCGKGAGGGGPVVDDDRLPKSIG